MKLFNKLNQKLSAAATKLYLNLKNEDGFGTVELAIILIILIGIAVTARGSINDIMTKIVTKISKLVEKL